MLHMRLFNFLMSLVSLSSYVSVKQRDPVAAGWRESRRLWQGHSGFLLASEQRRGFCSWLLSSSAGQVYVHRSLYCDTCPSGKPTSDKQRSFSPYFVREDVTQVCRVLWTDCKTAAWSVFYKERVFPSLCQSHCCPIVPEDSTPRLLSTITQPFEQAA